MVLNGIHVEQWHEDKEQVIVMLHGFTGSTKTWQYIAKQLSAYRIIAIDAMGHGQTMAPVEVSLYEMAQQIARLEEVFVALDLHEFTLVGYSMGGRIALSYTVKYPQRVTKLILESASPGLRTEKERATRKEADDQLAASIEAYGLQSFIDRWENIPLFASQKSLPKQLQAEIRAERMSQRTQGLANSLRGLGTGMMPQLWDDLASIEIPVVLVTGELDSKFVQIATTMQKQLKNAKHYTVPAVGHAIHVENPEKFATIVKETIS